MGEWKVIISPASKPENTPFRLDANITWDFFYSPALFPPNSPFV